MAVTCRDGAASVCESGSADGTGTAVPGWLPIKLQAKDARSNINIVRSLKTFLLFMDFSFATKSYTLREQSLPASPTSYSNIRVR
jgi:hypothetical protein